MGRCFNVERRKTMPETDENMIASVLEMLKNKQYAALQKVLEDLNPADIAEAMETT